MMFMSKHVVHHKYAALPRRQLSKSPPYCQPFLTRSVRHLWMIRVAEMGVLPSGAPPATIDGGVDDDAMKPCERRRVPPKPATVTENPQKRILHNVVGLIAHVACGNSAQLPP